MKKVKTTILLVLAVLLTNVLNAQLDRSIQPKPGPAPEFKIGEYKTFTLDNGLKVIVVENHKVPRISYQLTVDVDPIFQKDAVGYVSMAGSLLRNGTKNKTKGEIDEAVDFIGASLNTFENGMYGLTLTKHKETFLSLMSDVLLNPAFPEEELEKTKKQSISGLVSSKTNPGFIANRVGQKLCYGNHPYAELETEETIENITREHLITYYNTYYKPNVSYLVIVGDISLKQAKEDAQKYFGSWQKAEVPDQKYQFPNKNVGTRVALVHKDDAVQSYINITYPVQLKVGDKDGIPAILANDILGSGVFSARLIANLREDKGYTYGAYSNLSSDELVGQFRAYAQVGTDVTDDAVNQFLIEMNRMESELVDDETLNLFKTVRTGSLARSLESPQTIARFAYNTLKYNLPADYYQKYFENVDAVTKEQVLAVSKKYIDADQAIIVVVGDKNKLLEPLKKYSASNTVEVYDMYGNPVKEEAKAAIPEGISAEKVIENYIEVTGGREKLEAVQDLTIEASTTMNGMNIQQKTYYKLPNKYASIMSMNGNVMVEQKYNGERGLIKSFQGEQELTGEMLEEFKEQTVLNPELKYNELGITVSLEGLDKVEGKDAYKIKVTKSSGKFVYDYYDMESGLKVSSKQTVSTPQGDFTTTQSYSDYQEVDGIKMPFLIKISGMQNLELKVDSIIINSNLADDIF